MTLPCNKCHEQVAICEGMTSPFGVLCESCSAKDASMAIARALKATHEAKWALMCPTRFFDTEMAKLPQIDRTERALRWNRNQDGAGLNLWGHPSTGKTRSLFLILKREHFGGLSIRVFTAGQFERELERRAYKRAPFIAALCRVDLLAFDDFDKMNLTREMEKTFFALMDRRMAEKRPVLLTHNSTAPELEYKFRYGEPLVRRIRDFCQSVHFPKPLNPTHATNKSIFYWGTASFCVHDRHVV